MKKATIALLDQMMTGYDIHSEESSAIQDIPADELAEALGYVIGVSRGIHQEREALSFAADEKAKREDLKNQRFAELAAAIIPTFVDLFKRSSFGTSPPTQAEVEDLLRNNMNAKAGPFVCSRCAATFKTSLEVDAHYLAEHPAKKRDANGPSASHSLGND